MMNQIQSEKQNEKVLLWKRGHPALTSVRQNVISAHQLIATLHFKETKIFFFKQVMTNLPSKCNMYIDCIYYLG